MRVYIGTYTGGESEGIYQGEFDMASGQLENVTLAVRADQPSFLAISPQSPYLYAVSEVSDFGGQQSGAVGAYVVNRDTGGLNLVNCQSSGGPGPCHLSGDPSRRFILVANYEGGSVALLPIMPDGSLAEATCIVTHEGSGVHPIRQDRPHAHSITLDPNGRFALVADLGIDALLVYEVNAAQSLLVSHGEVRVSSSGAGPRHLAFAPSGRFVYVINELDSSLTTWGYDDAEGRLTEMRTVSALPPGFSGPNTAADVHVHPSGRYVYASNRGHDSLAVFTLDAQTGAAALREVVPTGGQTPRNFAIDPTGAFLLVAHQDTHTLDTFAIHPHTGSLTPTGHATSVPNPVCVQFAPW